MTLRLFDTVSYEALVEIAEAVRAHRENLSYTFSNTVMEYELENFVSGIRAELLHRLVDDGVARQDKSELTK